MSSIEAERKPFLAIEDSTEDQQAFIERYSLLQKGRAGRQCLLTLLQSALLVLNIFFLVSNISMHEICSVGTENKSGFERTFSPAEVALHYITVEELNYGHQTSLYTGEPRPELDQAWSRLLRSTLLNISEQEMMQMNKTSLALLNGGGYVGYLESFHMLHCLKRIYQSHHPDHYPQQQQEGAFDSSQLYHCLDVLREGVMCNADVTINTLLWQNSTKVRGARPGPRKCIDWDSLQSWADGRTLAAKDRESFLAKYVVPFDEPGSIGPEILFN